MNTIGLNNQKTKQLADKLNVLLANYQMYYQNLRGFHWNVKGSQFFELHEKFEELYTTANEHVDEIAERILTLEGAPLHTFSDYLDKSEIKEAKNVSEGNETVKLTLENLKVILKHEREILELASEADDEGTVALMSDYIKDQEKMVWMLRAYNSSN